MTKMIKFSGIGPFKSGLAPIKQKRKWGFINKLGDFEIPCEYDLVYFPYNEGKIAVKKNKKWGYITTENIAVTDFIYDDVSPFLDGLASVKQGKKYGIINVLGKMIIQPIYSMIKQSPNQIFSAKKDKKWGVIDNIGNIILPFIYDSMTEFSHGVSYVCIGQKHGFINLQGKFVLELTSKQYVYPIDFHKNFEARINFEFIAIVDKKGGRKYDWSIYSNKGELTADSLKYNWINSFHDDLAAVCSYDKRKWGMINSLGQQVISCEYDNISPFLCGLAFASKGIYCGYIDKNNQIKIPFKYKLVSTFYDNVAFVSPDGWNGHLIDTEANVILNLRKEKTLNNIFDYISIYK